MQIHKEFADYWFLKLLLFMYKNCIVCLNQLRFYTLLFNYLPYQISGQGTLDGEVKEF